MDKIILASKSPYRKELLKRLGIEFEVDVSNVDENIFKASISDPENLSMTLSKQKALSVLQRRSGTIVIGSDQVGHFNGDILGKPKTIENAFAQLKTLQGNTHTLYTAVTVMSAQNCIQFSDRTELTMKNLTDTQIKRYIEIDTPLDCAGGYKIEKAGIGLFEKIETHDFSAIVGLPLMTLSKVLNEFGYDYLS